MGALLAGGSRWTATVSSDSELVADLMSTAPAFATL